MRQTDTPLELWGGAECTIARLGDQWRDQAAETGHREREGDTADMAALGIRRVRFPILWEAVAPDRSGRFDFAWADARLEALRAGGIAVIGGLLHHGSGPSHTSLVDPDFPKKLADYAGRVAERYPWIDLWTPVNEPLTTARFSGLYGHWYPHRRDYPSFLAALVNQCLGTARAMNAIRAVNPGARLLHTEDLGKTFATPPLREQAAHENSRRWLSFDLLLGRVTPGHPWHALLLENGVARDALDELEAGAGAPDLLGINHYLTSERFLDHRQHLYDPAQIGGNGRDAYADAEAVRVKRLEQEVGLAPRLREAWARYRLPLALTEVHHGCTRDEQLRWFAEAWTTAQTLREEGMDLRAVTLWSLFGNMDWRSLLTRREGHYDPGAYDIRAPRPRATALAKAATTYAAGEAFDHPVLDMPGWWRRPQRLYGWHEAQGEEPPARRRLLITGASGTLGRAFARICAHRGLPFALTGRAELDICDPGAIGEALERYRPWAVINTAGFVRVADAERERGACFAWNADGPALLARRCADLGLPLLTFSSDLVFDGRLGRPYREDDPVSPACVYGESKAEAERRVTEAGGSALIVRTAAFFGPWDEHNFAWQVLKALRSGRPMSARGGALVSPTFVPDLCHAALDLLIDGETGLWHLANEGASSWLGFARDIAELAGFDADRVAEEAGASTNNALVSRRGALLRPFAPAIDAWLREVAEVEAGALAA